MEFKDMMTCMQRNTFNKVDMEGIKTHEKTYLIAKMWRGQVHLMSNTAKTCLTHLKLNFNDKRCPNDGKRFSSVVCDVKTITGHDTKFNAFWNPWHFYIPISLSYILTSSKFGISILQRSMSGSHICWIQEWRAWKELLFILLVIGQAGEPANEENFKATEAKVSHWPYKNIISACKKHSHKW